MATWELRALWLGASCDGGLGALGTAARGFVRRWLEGFGRCCSVLL
jgi:hypothetical protein